MKTGRNDPCPCGSRKKYKHCCGAAGKAAHGFVNSDAVTAQMLAAFNRGDYHSALTSGQNILNICPDNADAQHVCGLSQYRLGNLPAARSHLEQATRYAPGNALAFSNLGRILEQLAEYEAAERACRRALALDPALADAHHNLANILKNLGRHDDALHHCREAVRHAPQVVSYRSNLGVSLMMRGETEEAQDHFGLVIKQDPSFALAYGNLGALYLQTGKFELAREALQQALRCKPDYSEALANLGLVQHQLMEHQEAVDCYRRAMELDPAIRRTHAGNLITVLEDAGNLVAAHEVALEVLESPAECAGSLIAAIKNFGKTCDFVRRERAERLWHQYVIENKLPVGMLLGCNYSGIFGPEELFALHRRWAEAVERPDVDHVVSHPVEPLETGRRLRIGYLSPDFRKHATAYFVEPILVHHDRESFEIYGYHNHGKHDEMTEQVRSRCEHFLSTSDLSDDDLLARIRNDGIDILVDLAGHTDGSRLKMMARRAAPIQATFLGYPNTTGLQAMDYIIVDRYIAETGMAYHTETPAILPECLATFQPLPVAPGNVALPCLRTGHVTFGSLNNLMKLTPAAVSCWARILAQVPGSKLLIAYGGADASCTRENLEREFARHGIGADRLLLKGKLSREEFLDLYRMVDIALDTFPYTGTTTTCEALLMNVPVVSKTGPAQRERVSASILSHLGLGRLIADDTESYVGIAVHLAQDRNELSALRQSMPALLSASVLNQPQRLTRSLERLYREMWERHVRRMPSREPLRA